MQTRRVCRFLFSQLFTRWFNSHYLPNSPIIQKSPFLSSFAIAHFTSIPNRPLRGDPRNITTRENFSSEDDHDFLIRNQNNATSRFPNTPQGKDFQGFREDNAQRIIDDAPFSSGKEKVPKEFNFGNEDMGSGDTKAEENQLPKDANEIFNKMKQTGLIPNVVAMLDGLCKEGQIQEAMKLFGLMREKKTIPEVVVYTAVVEGFCNAAKFDDAKRIFRKMQKNGIVPNSISYLILIQGLSSGNRLADAVEFCMEMLDAGLFLNVATLTGLVQVFVKEKGIEEAEGFLRSLREKGLVIDEKAVREYLNKKGPLSPMVWEAIFGKKNSQRTS